MNSISRKLLSFSTKLLFVLSLSINQVCAMDEELKSKFAEDIQFLNLQGLNEIFRLKNRNEIIELVKKYNIDVKQSDKSGNTILHFAAQKGYNNVIGALVSLGADIDAKANELILVDWDTIKDDPNLRDDMTEEVFNRDIYKSNGFFPAKYILKQYGKRENRKACTFKNLLNNQEDSPFEEEDGIALRISECTPLHDAICNNNIDTVKLLIQLGADVNQSIKHEFLMIFPVPGCGCGALSYATLINPINIANNWNFKEIEEIIKDNKGVSRQEIQQDSEGLA